MVQVPGEVLGQRHPDNGNSLLVWSVVSQDRLPVSGGVLRNGEGGACKHYNTIICWARVVVFSKKNHDVKKSTSAALSGSIFNKLRFVSDSKEILLVSSHASRSSSCNTCLPSFPCVSWLRKKKQFAKSWHKERVDDTTRSPPCFFSHWSVSRWNAIPSLLVIFWSQESRRHDNDNDDWCKLHTTTWTYEPWILNQKTPTKAYKKKGILWLDRR